ncbi:uncharacterized protein K452DRAFT_353292 [Aplosporella prunicola CBS 121167]|uniref:Monopolin complex subunit Csm1/Pcs1 C-terminal domain-containing protein n=1 Tax=Aplosporella prunicola CBS 121167 TaxID=1176127 RepID=A0A6A6B1H6_9PEZI|nr:uncharacterized protein K452DRAFT_353292 [Aplosporella prunicola CBS 121167]KAF2138062.1 hypothetical protein K452DRAFT_353292 [Aplosporella prunicola CBS 121167]
MPSAALDFSCALVTGGGGGIGKALAEYLLKKGKTVIIAGRTESTLQQTAKEIGATAYYTLDTGAIDTIPAFINKVTTEHPELDCLVNNAGVQRPLQVQKQDPADFLEKADQEININIRGPMHLALGLLDHFKSKPNGALIVNVSSVLAFIPFSIINPVYNGTKAWLHFWSMNLRTQLADTKVRVVEIAPPTVATDLHREREDPDDNKKENNPNALSVDEFIEEVAQKLERGDETIGAGMSADIIDRWYKEFGPHYEKAQPQPLAIMPKRAPAPTLSNMIDESASEDEFAQDHAANMLTSDPAIENTAPSKKRSTGKPAKASGAAATKSNTAKTRTSGRRTSGASVTAAKTKTTKKAAASKRKTLAERQQEGNESDTEEVDEFDHIEGRPAKSKSEVDDSVVTADARAAPKSKGKQPKKEESVEPPEVDPMEVEPSIEEIQSRLASTKFKQRQPVAPIRRGGSNDPALRRKLGDMTKKFENMDVKYRNLREVGQSSDERARAQNDLIASLKKELAAQRSLANESKSLKKQISKLSSENKSLQNQLSESQTEIKSLNTKLAATLPGSAVKAQRTVMVGSAEAAKEAQIRQLKEDLYSDLTGLIVRGVKRGEEEDVYDCIQTGRNGTLHFHLSIAVDDASKPTSQSYEDAEFAYVPLLDENRDRELLEILPDYLTEEICFPRSSAAKFYAKVVDCMTKKIVIEE